uniref:Homeodomain-like domain-containing protein n=1 Tax=Candidatus Kentrum sp. TUN TaxID=2126343 RepID=A0A450ZGU2_9GAMM|nr:MAG: hypothetical protein BECKTUN1418F_GA0071002_100831 [Candidatus Kentron sp. TUN]VFK52948.1 MAG: hypothetical protein BECKTUN1418E_GA0071001_101131 [Candidatus Kentron sp. TUN]VFK57573.1 MAG: hypothetical protein BECKTUN1418D_GA0071000_10658 [Candidatus Kentron sp. TUN]
MDDQTGEKLEYATTNQKTHTGGAERIEIDPERVRDLARLGMRKRRIAAALGISKTTFYERLREPNSAILDTFEGGRAEGIERLTRTLIDSLETRKQPDEIMKALAKLEPRVWGKDADILPPPKEKAKQSEGRIVILPDNGR